MGYNISFIGVVLALLVGVYHSLINPTDTYYINASDYVERPAVVYSVLDHTMDNSKYKLIQYSADGIDSIEFSKEKFDTLVEVHYTKSQFGDITKQAKSVRGEL